MTHRSLGILESNKLLIAVSEAPVVVFSECLIELAKIGRRQVAKAMGFGKGAADGELNLQNQTPALTSRSAMEAMDSYRGVWVTGWKYHPCKHLR